MISFQRLEVHAAHACNLTCESCSHFSNHGHTGVLSLADLKTWLAPWSRRIAPREMSLCGGEPTLNPRLSELVLLCHDAFPEAAIEVVTNGFFLARHPGLGEVLRKTRGTLHISSHSTDSDYLTAFKAAAALAHRWAATGTRVVFRASEAYWTRRYEGYGPTMAPVTQSAKPQQAWDICVAKLCVQLHEGRLWKCPPVTYIGMQVKRWPEVGDRFPLRMGYQPLDEDASDETVREFLERKAEAVCRECPSERLFFVPGTPLVPARDLLVPARNLLLKAPAALS